LKEKLLYFLKQGLSTRNRLSSIFYQISDRKIRKVIAELQIEGYPIINLGRGYSLAKKDDLEVYIQREKRRAISILSKLKHLRPQTESLIKQLELL